MKSKGTGESVAVQTLLQDLRYGLRLVAKNPGFSSIAILTLALGIGANTAIFSVVDAALLRALPYRSPDRLVYAWSAEKARGIKQSTVSIPDLRDWRRENRVFDGLAGWWSGSYNLSGGGEPRMVIGVMPAEFSSPFPDVQLWIPWPARAETTAERGDRFLRVVARLKPGVTVERAAADMDTVARRLEQTYREDSGVTVYLVPAGQQITGSARPALLVLQGAVGFVLLIGCANVLRLVVGHGMRLALAGAAIGLAGALILARLMSSLLYGVKPGDPPTFLAAFAALESVALLACYIPARRATTVGPVAALRQE
jgi:hypothetical protein